MTKLTDTQSILLSTASQRGDGSLLPLPDSLRAGGGTSKAIAALVSRAFAEERETSEQDAAQCSDGEVHYGVFITAAGLAAIGIVPDSGAGEGAAVPDAPPATAQPRSTKAGAVLALLQREQGATLPELIEATGWLPHTTRAALTGLRKKGHVLEKSKRHDATCYRIASAA